MTLYELNEDFKRLLAMAEEGDLDEEVLKDTLEAMEGEYEDKLDSYAIVIKDLESTIAKVDGEMSRLKDVRTRLSNNIDRMKRSVYTSMVATNHKKVQGEHFTWAIQKNGGKQKIAITKPVNEIPGEYFRVKYELDNEYIRMMLDSGADLDFAHYEERGESLRLK